MDMRYKKQQSYPYPLGFAHMRTSAHPIFYATATQKCAIGVFKCR